MLDEELPRILAAAATGRARILPVVLSPCRYERADALAGFQSINDPRTPVIGMTRCKQEQVWDRVAMPVESAA